MGDNASSLAKKSAKLAHVTRQALANRIAIAKLGAVRRAKAIKTSKTKE